MQPQQPQRRRFGSSISRRASAGAHGAHAHEEDAGEQDVPTPTAPKEPTAEAPLPDALAVLSHQHTSHGLPAQPALTAYSSHGPGQLVGPQVLQPIHPPQPLAAAQHGTAQAQHSAAQHSALHVPLASTHPPAPPSSAHAAGGSEELSSQLRSLELRSSELTRSLAELHARREQQHAALLQVSPCCSIFITRFVKPLYCVYLKSHALSPP